MDGRPFCKWWLSGCLVIGAFGCNRNAVQHPWGSQSAINKSAPAISMPTPSKSFWGGSKDKPPAPTEVVTEEPRKGPPKPETYAALANVQLESAFAEETPEASRQELLDLARQAYQKALQIDGKNRVALQGLAKYYVRLNEREKAVETYKKYFAAYPKDKEIAHEVALAHAQWKDWPGAVAWCEFALKIDPENLSIRKTLAFCLARAGKWEEGFKVLCQVVPEAQARYLMARVLEHQKQPEACRMQLELALKADPSYIPAREFLAELTQTELPDERPNAHRVITVGGIEEEQP